MVQDKVFEMFNNGLVVFPSRSTDVSALPWYEHPAFKGVYLKDLVKGSETNGAFSCHMVKIKKGCEVGEHSHDKQWEFNEALEGTGTFVIQGKEMACKAGFSYATPPGVSHIVSAQDEDLYILAKFIPAL
jgi:quercetin dioxygenase-like cupin family protein